MALQGLVASAFIAELEATFVSLPFLEKDHRMLIFFQNSPEKEISDLEFKLFEQSSLKIKKYLGQLQYRRTELHLPKGA